MSTYLAMYIESLEARINAGGLMADVEKALDEYNSFDERAFKAWLTALTKVSCMTCGRGFKPGDVPASAEVLCPEHAPK